MWNIHGCMDFLLLNPVFNFNTILYTKNIFNFIFFTVYRKKTNCKNYECKKLPAFNTSWDIIFAANLISSIQLYTKIVNVLIWRRCPDFFWIWLVVDDLSKSHRWSSLCTPYVILIDRSRKSWPTISENSWISLGKIHTPTASLARCLANLRGLLYETFASAYYEKMPLEDETSIEIYRVLL